MSRSGVAVTGSDTRGSVLRACAVPSNNRVTILRGCPLSLQPRGCVERVEQCVILVSRDARDGLWSTWFATA